jgi:serine/threonine-protein kinase
MAPEQARNHASPSSDVYSLGVMLFQMLVGRTPFLGKDSIGLIMQHLRDDPPAFAAVSPGVEIPPQVEAVVRRCLAKTPEQRYASMDEVIEAVRAAASQTDAAHASIAVDATPTPAPLFGDTGSLPRGLPPHPFTREELVGYVTEPVVAYDGPPDVRSFATEKPPARAGKLVTLAAMLVVVGAGVVGWRRGSAVVDDARPPTVASRPQKLTSVRFRLETQPEGAFAFVNGVKRGKTPLTVEVPTGPEGEAVGEIRFELEGHLPLSVTAAGRGQELKLIQRLQKAPRR